MTLRELSQLYYLNCEITAEQKRLAALKKQLRNISETNAAQKAGDRKAFDESVNKHVAEIVDLEAIISAKITQCLHERNRIERYIAGIPDSLTRQIFTLRFVKGLPWVRVAYGVGGSNTADSVKKICYRYIDIGQE